MSKFGGFENFQVFVRSDHYYFDFKYLQLLANIFTRSIEIHHVLEDEPMQVVKPEESAVVNGVKPLYLLYFR